MFMAGCASSVNTVERQNSLATPNIVEDKRIITDRSLANDISVLSVNESYVDNDLLKIQVKLLNQDRDPVSVNYQFVFTNTDGMTSSSSRNFKFLRFLGKETKTISAVARTPDAVDFQLKLIEKTR